MNQKNELKIIELQEKYFQPKYSKTELLIDKILTIISIILLFRQGFIFALITGFILKIITDKTFIKKIKQYQEDNPQ